MSVSGELTVLGESSVDIDVVGYVIATWCNFIEIVVFFRRFSLDGTLSVILV